MKSIIATGLVMLSLLLLLVALRPAGVTPRSVPKGNPASAQSQQNSKTAHGRPAAVRALGTTRLAQPDRAMLLVAIEAETDPDRRSEALERAVDSVCDADLPSMLDSLVQDGGPGGAELRNLLVRRWAESDAPTAAAWTLQLPESPIYRAALEQVAIAWANSDLIAAASWVHALPEGDSKQAATLDLAYEAARTEPVMALELANTTPATRERDDLLVHAVSQWPGTDSAAAAAWAMKVLDPALRERLVGAVAVTVARQDGAAAATLAASALGAGAEQDRTVVSIVQRWAENSPQAAAAWVSQFPDIPSRGAAVENLVAVWTAQDAEAAGNWLHGLAAGPLLDVAITAYAQALADRDRTSAVGTPVGGI